MRQLSTEIQDYLKNLKPMIWICNVVPKSLVFDSKHSSHPSPQKSKVGFKVHCKRAYSLFWTMMQEHNDSRDYACERNLKFLKLRENI